MKGLLLLQKSAAILFLGISLVCVLAGIISQMYRVALIYATPCLLFSIIILRITKNELKEYGKNGKCV